MLNALTIDVEDYFMVSAFSDSIPESSWDRYDLRVGDNTIRVLDLLDEQDAKGTFFVVGWVAERCPGIVKEIRKRGHEIGCHSHSHRMIFGMTTAEFREDTRRGKNILEEIIGEKILGYRAPSYSITGKSLWALDILIEEGFQYDSSIFPIIHDRYGFPGFGRFPAMMNRNGTGQILEIPLSTVKVFGKNLPIAGGGYFRLYPFGWTAGGIRSLNEKEKQAAIVYIHPWEIDPDQPRMRGKMLSMFRHYVNIGTTEKKLISLLETFRFAPMKDVFNSMLQ